MTRSIIRFEADILYIDESKYYAADGDVIDVDINSLSNLRLSDTPIGYAIQICRKVIGGTDLFPVEPFASYWHRTGNRFIAEASTALIYPDDRVLSDKDMESYILERVNLAQLHLERMRSSGHIEEFEIATHPDIAYVSYTVPMWDQRILDARDFVFDLETQIEGDFPERLLFVCHASEDKAFVEILIDALDRRGLHTWYDKREILVGDSIVEEVNAGLDRASFVIVVMSPASMSKPWVTRELSSSLMRQLRDQSVQLMPVLYEDCEIPPLLNDIKYADFRVSFDAGFGDLIRAIRQ